MLNQAVGRLKTAREVAAGGKSVSPEEKRRILRNLHASRRARVAFVDLSTHIGASLYHRWHRGNVDIIFPFHYVSQRL